MERAITLREAVEFLSCRGIHIRWTKDLTLEDFLSYYDQHYAGEPENLQFLVDDIHDIFGTA